MLPIVYLTVSNFSDYDVVRSNSSFPSPARVFYVMCLSGISLNGDMFLAHHQLNENPSSI